MSDEGAPHPMAGQGDLMGEVLTKAGKDEALVKQLIETPGKDVSQVNGLPPTPLDVNSKTSQMEVDDDNLNETSVKENTGVANGVRMSAETQENGIGLEERMDVSEEDTVSDDTAKAVEEVENVVSGTVSDASTLNGEPALKTSAESTDDDEVVNASGDHKNESSSGSIGAGKLADDDVQILSNPPKPEDDVIVIDDDDDDDDKKETAPPAKSVRKKSSQAVLCKCILCGEMVRLSSLGYHVNSIHSKLIVKGKADIECKVCLKSFNWSDFVDHAQTKHKWSIVKNAPPKNAPPKNVPDSQLRKDYFNMGIFCMWCRESTDVAAVAAHFKAVHKVDEGVIGRALYLNHKKGGDKSSAPIPTGIMGAMFVTCQECGKDLKFANVISHFQTVHKNSKKVPIRSAKKPAPTAQSTPTRVTVPPTTPRPTVQTSRSSVPAISLNSNEQLITLFKGHLNQSKSPNYALVKLAHDGKDKILSIPLGHPIAKHRVHTVAVKGKLDDIPALIQSVTDMLANELPPPDPVATTVPERTIAEKASASAAKSPEVRTSVLSVSKPDEIASAAADTGEDNTSKDEEKEAGEVKDSSEVEEKKTGEDETEISKVEQKGPNGKETDTTTAENKETEEEKEEANKTSTSEPTEKEDKSNDGEVSSAESKEETEGETAPKSSPKKSSPRGSFNRLLELQKDSLASTPPEEPEAEQTGTPLRRSSRRAKMAAKLKIKSVVEKEVQDWKKQLNQPEYIPESDEEDQQKGLKQQNVSSVPAGSIPSNTRVASSQHATRTIEQFVFKTGQDGRRVLMRIPSQGSKNVAPVRIVTTPAARQRLTSPPATNIIQRPHTSPVAQKRPVGGLSPIAPRKKTPAILQQQRSPVTIQASPLRGSPQTSTATLLPGGITLTTQPLYQQQAVPGTGQVLLGSNPGYIIQRQLVQPTILQQPFGVQLQPQTVPIQNPNVMMMQQQQQLQLVTTAQGQQILVMPNNNVVQNQQVVFSQMQQNRVVVGASQAQTKGMMTQPAVKLPVLSTTTTTPSSQQPLRRVTRSAAQPPTKAAPVVTAPPIAPAPPTKAHDLDTLIIKRGKDSLVRISDLQRVEDGYVCHQSDLSVAVTKDRVMREVQLVKKKQTPVPVTMPDKIGFQSKKASDDFLSKYDEFDRMVKINILTKDIIPSELPDIPSVMFECARCGGGMPTFMLLRIHLAQCFSHPPAEEKAYIIRMPFPLLQMYYDTGAEPGGVVSCKLCSKIIPRSNSKDLEPLQAHVREHQAQKTAQKGGSVTFGVLSLNKVCILKCKICGETVMRLWQDIVPMSVHLQKHIKGNVEILCNQPPVVGITNKAHAQHISKKAYTWVDYIVPPFTLENPPISEKQKNLDYHVATQGILHYESLLPRRKRRHMMLPETPKLRGKANQNYQSNMKPLIIETSTADTMTSYDIKRGKTTNLLNSIKLMPSPDKIKRSTLTASIPIKAKHKTLMTQSTGSNRRKIFRQGQYRSARLQEKRDKYMEEMDEAAAQGTSSPLDPSTPVKLPPEMVGDEVHPVTCSKLHSAEKPSSKNSNEDRVTKIVPEASHVVSKPLAGIKSSSPKEDTPKKEYARRSRPFGTNKVVTKLDSPKKEAPPVKKVHVPNPEMTTIPDDSSDDDDVQEIPLTEPTWAGKGTEYVEPVMPPRTPSPEKPETPPPPITETDISDYLHILDGGETTAQDKLDIMRPLPEIGDVSLSDYFGDSANTSILCEPLIIEQSQAPMYFTRSVNTGYRFRCSFSKCEAAVPNNTLVMLAHLSQHFRVRIAGDFSQNGSVSGHRRTCKSLPLTINQVGAHFTLSDREEASLHGGEVQMPYVCQWRNCSRTRTFKKGLITHLYRHVTFHLISDMEHAVLKERSKPLKLSSAQFVPHGSGTKLITETMSAGHGPKFTNKKNQNLSGPQNKDKTASGRKLSAGNYGDGSPLGSLIEKLTEQIMGDVSPEVSEKPSVSSNEGESASEDTSGRTEDEKKLLENNEVPAGEKSIPGDQSNGQSGSGDSLDGKRKHDGEKDGEEDTDAAIGPVTKKARVSGEGAEMEKPAEPEKTAGPDKTIDSVEEEMPPPAKRLKMSDDDVSLIGTEEENTAMNQTEGKEVGMVRIQERSAGLGSATDKQLQSGEGEKDTAELKVQEEEDISDSERSKERLETAKDPCPGDKVGTEEENVLDDESEKVPNIQEVFEENEPDGKDSAEATEEVEDSIDSKSLPPPLLPEPLGTHLIDSESPPPPLLPEPLSNSSETRLSSEDEEAIPDLQSTSGEGGAQNMEGRKNKDS